MERCSTPRWGRRAPDPINLILKEKAGVWRSCPRRAWAIAHSPARTVLYYHSRREHVQMETISIIQLHEKLQTPKIISNGKIFMAMDGSMHMKNILLNRTTNHFIKNMTRNYSVKSKIDSHAIQNIISKNINGIFPIASAFTFIERNSNGNNSKRYDSLEDIKRIIKNETVSYKSMNSDFIYGEEKQLLKMNFNDVVSTGNSIQYNDTKIIDNKNAREATFAIISVYEKNGSSGYYLFFNSEQSISKSQKIFYSYVHNNLLGVIALESPEIACEIRAMDQKELYNTVLLQSKGQDRALQGIHRRLTSEMSGGHAEEIFLKNFHKICGHHSIIKSIDITLSKSPCTRYDNFHSQPSKTPVLAAESETSCMCKLCSLAKHYRGINFNINFLDPYGLANKKNIHELFGETLSQYKNTKNIKISKIESIDDI